MSESIQKLQPDRTISLRGFDTFASAAAIHAASSTGFSVSGIFRDPADFAVVLLYDADNFFEHPSIKYLPDFNFTNLVLSFDLSYFAGLQPIDSPKYNWIDWATLDCIRADGTTAQVRLWDNATLVGTSFPAASAALNVTTSGAVQPGDRISLWYQNLAFDYSVPDYPPSVTFTFFAEGTGTTHSITVAGTTYSYTETDPAGESSSAQATALVAAMASDPNVTAVAAANTVTLTVLSTVFGVAIPVSASEPNSSSTVYLYLSNTTLVAEAIVAQINAANWVSANATHSLLASSTGAQITVTAGRYGIVAVNGTAVAWTSGARFAGLLTGSTIFLAGVPYTVESVQSPVQLTLTAAAPTASGVVYSAPRGGIDGNLIQLYTLAKTSTLAFDQAQVPLSGGSSAVTWNCSLDFTALGIDQIRQCWLTFAPALANASAFTATEWQAVFSSWQLTAGSGSVPALQVAGPGTVRIDDSDTACAYTGVWNPEAGFYSNYFAHVTSALDATLTITYNCQFTHNLYVGTSLYSDRAVAGVSLDGDAVTHLNCVVPDASAVVTRRLLRSAVAPGRHTVTFTMVSAGVFYFDFLEAAVLSDVPNALTPRSTISAALDFDTDHTYKLSPARLMWIMDQLGYAGPMNEYLGVFWWNQRVLSGGSLSTAQVTFSGSFASGDTVFVTLNGSTMGKSVFPADTLATIAAHFADYINGSFVGAWASASAATLTINARSPAPAYTLTLAVSATSATGEAALTQTTPPGAHAAAEIDFSGTFATGGTVFLTLNGSAMSRTISSGDTPATIASAFAADINGLSLGATATASAAALTITAGSPAPGYTLTISVGATSAHATVSLTLPPQAGTYGTWLVDDTASPPLNRAARDWHSDFFALCAARGREVTTSCSLELVNPPAGYAALFPDSTPATTATGFGSLISTQCAVGSSQMVAYQKTVYRNIAGLQTAAGLTPSVQFGEFLWWYFAGSSGMAYYDSQTQAAALAALGRPLQVFLTPSDDPTVNSSADATFLRNRLRNHVAALATDLRSAYPTVRCEVLWPYDVNYPAALAGGLGGQLNRFVNLPVEWQTPSTSGLDRIKVEALAFGAILRNLDLAKQAIALFPSFGWPASAVRYLVPVFGTATPWPRELALVWAQGLPFANLWAIDHVCLLNLPVPEPGLERRAFAVFT
jgi:hypothetical protein